MCENKKKRFKRLYAVSVRGEQLLSKAPRRVLVACIVEREPPADPVPGSLVTPDPTTGTERTSGGSRRTSSCVAVSPPGRPTVPANARRGIAFANGSENGSPTTGGPFTSRMVGTRALPNPPPQRGTPEVAMVDPPSNYHTPPPGQQQVPQHPPPAAEIEIIDVPQQVKWYG